MIKSFYNGDYYFLWADHFNCQFVTERINRFMWLHVVDYEILAIIFMNYFHVILLLQLVGICCIFISFFTSGFLMIENDNTARWYGSTYAGKSWLV